jgi:DNA-binding MarR family transcriptional regulator
MTATRTEVPLRPAPRVAKELVKSSGFLLARLGLGFKGKAIEQIEKAGFEPHQYSVLAMLGEDVRETQAAIADALMLDPSRLVAVLDSLEEKGLVMRQRDPQDRRRHVVKITPEGKRQLQKLRGITKKLEDEYFAAFTPEERATFHEFLLRLASEHDPRCGFAPNVSSKPE